jgi:hypothetical protein
MTHNPMTCFGIASSVAAQKRRKTNATSEGKSKGEETEKQRNRERISYSISVQVQKKIPDLQVFFFLRPTSFICFQPEDHCLFSLTRQP